MSASIARVPRDGARRRLDRAGKSGMESMARRFAREKFDNNPTTGLKSSSSLIEGHIPDTILKVERVRCLRAGS